MASTQVLETFNEFPIFSQEVVPVADFGPAKAGLGACCSGAQWVGRLASRKVGRVLANSARP